MHCVKASLKIFTNLPTQSWFHHACVRGVTTRVSSIFQPTQTAPKESISKSKDLHSVSQKHLIELGFIKPAAAGTYCILPLAQRSLQKIIHLIDEELSKVGCQKLILPTLTHGGLWQRTGRLDSMDSELFKVKDRHNQSFVLSPTHEEAITDLISSVGHISHKQLPLLLYQISSKFRDEMKPRSGLLRTKEFLMKDLYTFDASVEHAEKTYQIISSAYSKIFDRLEIPYVKVKSDSGSMGGTTSEEFHYLAKVGEDQLSLCSNCQKGYNSGIDPNEINCASPGNCDFVSKSGIEVGHCFILGTRYSEPLKAFFTSAEGKQEPFVMGCYGLGITRILAAATECLSTPDELRWPLSIAPYKICIIPPKEGSKEADAAVLADKLANALSSIVGLENEVVMDDRTHLTIGRRCKDASRCGYPFLIVAGRTAACVNPTFEVFHTASGEKKVLSFEQTVDFMREKCIEVLQKQ